MADRAVRIVQITDFHLYGDPQLAAFGAWGDVKPQASLEATLALAKSKVPDAAAVLLTGDFTHDDTHQSYVNAREAIKAVFPTIPLLYTPGNHDTEMEVLTSVFTPEAGFVGPTTTDPLAQTTLGAWRVLLLNSSVKGAMHGELSEQTLSRVDAALAECDAAGAPALIALHHPPIPPAGEHPPWGVPHPRWGYPCLRDPQPEAPGAAAPGSRLLAVLAAHPGSARVLVHGHLHADVAHSRGDLRLYGGPSTCHQIATVAPTWTLITDVPPGFRLLELRADGTHATEVCRLSGEAVEQCRAPAPATPEQSGAGGMADDDVK